MPRVKINSISLYYELYGEGGEVIVFIMGLGMPGFMWEPQVRYFSENYRVLVFDNRGVGKSDKPPGPYTTQIMAEDTVKLMDKLGIDKAHIVGISMGGMIAQWIGIKYPQYVRSLVLAATYAVVDERVRNHVREGAKVLGIESGGDINSVFFSIAGNEWTEETFMKIADFLLPLTLSPEFIEKRKNEIKGWMQKMIQNPPTLNSFVSQVMATQTHNAIGELHKIKAPVLVITGTDDKLVPPSCSYEIKRRISGAKLVEIKGGPHGINIENEGEFNRAVENFIKGVS